MFKDKMRSVLGLHAADKNSIKDAVLAQISSPAASKTKKFRLKHILTACLALVFIIGAGGGVAIVAEAAEYNKAVEFFEENGLSSEGLSRNELKAVYRDITQKTFSYEKTAEVINNYSVKTYNIEIKATDSESLAFWWENRYNPSFIPPTDSIGYDFEQTNKFNYQGNLIYNIVRYINGVENWRSTLATTEEFFLLKQIIPYKDGVIVCGAELSNSSPAEFYEDIVLYRYSAEGDLIYKKRIKQVGSNQRMCLDNDILACANQETQTTETLSKAIQLTTINAETGDVLSRKNTVINYERFSVSNILPFGDGYLVQLSVAQEKKISEFHTITEYIAKFIKCSSDFEPIEEISVFDEETLNGKEIHFSYSATLGGKFYTVVTLGNNDGWQEFQNNYRNEHGRYPSYPEDPRFVVEEYYESLLLVFNPDGTIEEAYSVDNAMCVYEISGDLSVTIDGNLSWKVLVYTGEITNETPENFHGDNNCPYYLQFIEYEFLLDKEGNLLSQTPISTGWHGEY